MSRTRETIVFFIVAILIGTLIYQSWFQPHSIEQPSHSNEQASQSATPIVEEFSLPEHLLRIQGKLLVGARAFIDEMFAKQKQISGKVDSQQQASATTTIKNSIEQILKSGDDPEAKKLVTIDPVTERSLLRKRIALAAYFSLDDLTTQWLAALAADEARSEEEKQLDERLARAVSYRQSINSAAQKPDSTPVAELSSEDQSAIQRQLGWFGELLLAKRTEPNAVNEAKVVYDARATFLHFLSGAGIVLGAFFFGTICLLWFVIQFGRGKYQLRLDPPEVHPGWMLEIFALYLCGMLLLSFGLQGAAKHFPSFPKALGPSGMLALNAVGIVTLVAVLFWPALFGNPLSRIRHSVGFFVKSLTSFVSDIAIAPIFYMASWVVLLAILIVYSFVVNLLGVDLSQGTHPVIPMLLSADNVSVQIWIAILAVVVAPFVEEIMFRGALYGWLRSKMGRVASMLLCSLIFASVHPQGPIGIVPLMSVSMVLCLLREWRHSLVAPMIAHGCFNAGTLILVTSILGR